jgi:hypothetical protein
VLIAAGMILGGGAMVYLTQLTVTSSYATGVLPALALTAAARHFSAHHTGPMSSAVAATHGYTVAFTTSAALFGVGAVLAIILLPSRRRLQELRAAAVTAGRPPPAPG